MPRLRHARAALGTAVVVSTLLCAGGIGSVAQARPDDAIEPACSANSAALRYVVLFDAADSERSADDEVAEDCGQMVAYYPQIAVGVVTSRFTHFADRIGRDRAFSAQAAVGRHKSDETDGSADQITMNPAAVSGIDRTSEQWDMQLIHADEAHQITEGSRNVVVGVLDSGVDPNHPDLRGALDPSQSAGCLTGKPDTSRAAWEPTVSPHGTHVAGTIAAADDGHGITGVAPGVRIASVKVVDDDGFIFPEYAVCGLMWASAKHMTVTNNSYFVDPWLVTCDDGSEHVVHEAIRRAVDYGTQHGTLTVAAATNEDVDLTDTDGRSDADCKVLPAGLRGVVAVSAIGPNKLKASYSAYGLGVIDVTAPGGEVATGKQSTDVCVLSTVPRGYGRYCGTSMATPHATGVVALLASEHPKSLPQQLSRMLTNQAEPIPCPADYDLNGTGSQDAYCSGYGPYNSFHGHGMVDALAAVTR